jgi:hypothetical protein
LKPWREQFLKFLIGPFLGSLGSSLPRACVLVDIAGLVRGSELANNDPPLVAVDDLLDLGSLVAGSDDELRWVKSDLSILVSSELANQFRAVGVGTFTQYCAV